MNLQQLYATPEADLPKVLGGILLSENYGHIAAQSLAEMQFSYFHCKTCGEVNFEPDSHCKRRPPVDLTDANAANKFRDKYVAEFGEDAYLQKLVDTWHTPGRCGSFVTWATCHLQPKHIYLACAGLELERGKDESN